MAKSRAWLVTAGACRCPLCLDLRSESTGRRTAKKEPCPSYLLTSSPAQPHTATTMISNRIGGARREERGQPYLGDEVKMTICARNDAPRTSAAAGPPPSLPDSALVMRSFASVGRQGGGWGLVICSTRPSGSREEPRDGPWEHQSVSQ